MIRPLCTGISPIRASLTLAAFLGFAAGAPAGPNREAALPEAAPVTLDLDQAEAIAIRQSPSITAAQFRALASKQIVRQVRSAFFPQITGEISAVASGDTLSRRLGGSGISGKDTRIGASGGLTNPTILDRQSNGVIFSQLVTDFGRTWDLTAASKNQALSEAQRSLETRARIVALVDQAYFATLQAQAVLRVANETVSSRQLLLDQITALAKGQLRSSLDVSFANVALQQARLLQLEAENRVSTDLATLSNVMGYREPHRFALAEIPQFATPTANVADLISQALAVRPEVLSLRYELTAARRIVGAERAAHYPKVNIVGAAGRTTDGDVRVEGNYAAVGVLVDVPIFTGFRLSARDEEVRLRAESAAQSVREMEDLIAHDVDVALLNTQSAADKIKVSAALLASASEAFDLAEAKYRLGTTSLVELSQAQLAKLQAQIDHATATYEYQIQRLALDFQIGAPRYLTPPPATPAIKPSSRKALKPPH